MVTSERFPETHWRDQDLPLVLQALERLGAAVDVVAWDAESAVRWAAYDTLVMQSPWSMWTRLADFRAWVAARVVEGAHLLNPAGVLSLGMTKQYLGQLAGLGVATVPTVFVRGHDDRLRQRLAAVFPDSAARRSIVVKPESSGGALGAREFSFSEIDAAVAQVRAFGAAGVGALVQPYMNAIDTHRELGVIVTGGEISHAITKAAILRPNDDHHAFHPDARPYGELTAARRAVVMNAYRRVVEILPRETPEPLSIRLDFVLDPSTESELLLLEAETVAPVRFFPLFPAECQAYARQIVDRTAARRTVAR
jgi:hypothetical protein